MNGSICDLLNDDEDDILAKIQEESLRYLILNFYIKCTVKPRIWWLFTETKFLLYKKTTVSSFFWS